MSKSKFDKKELYDFLQEKYRVTKLPKQFFIKMANIFNGKLKGLLKPIPPEHMYDMWIRKSNYLDKVNMNNISKGKKIEGYLRLNYDLAIILSKYEDYLSWLDKQKALSSENDNLKDSITITDILYKQDNKNYKDNKDDKDNISDILDDLI